MSSTRSRCRPAIRTLRSITYCCRRTRPITRRTGSSAPCSCSWTISSATEKASRCSTWWISGEDISHPVGQVGNLQADCESALASEACDLCRSPIQHPQPRNARKLPGVVRHQGGSAADGRSGDQQIEGPYSRTLLLEFDADSRRSHRRSGIEGHVLNVLKARFQLAAAPGRKCRSERPILQLVNHDRWDRQLATGGPLGVS